MPQQRKFFPGWLVVTSGFVIMATCYTIFVNCMSLFQPLIVSDLGITLAQYNISNAISTVVSVVGSLVIGHVADKVSGPPSTSTSLRAHFCGRDAPARRSAGSAISARCVERECREVAICHSDVAWSAEVHAPVTKHWRQPVPRTTPPVRCVAKGGPAA